MAGTGPAPKLPEQRRNGNQKARGEWTELPRRVGHPVPALPEGDWHFRAVESWGYWWSDPASSQWTDSQFPELVELLMLSDEFWRGNMARAPEMRLRSDGLGLTLKGKQDRRWRVVSEDAPVPAAVRPASERRARLKVV
jgi:hypothetical protein